MKVACPYNCTDMMMQCRVNEQALISDYITQSDFTLSYTNGVGRDFELLCLGSTKNGLDFSLTDGQVFDLVSKRCGKGLKF